MINVLQPASTSVHLQLLPADSMPLGTRKGGTFKDVALSRINLDDIKIFVTLILIHAFVKHVA